MLKRGRGLDDVVRLTHIHRSDCSAVFRRFEDDYGVIGTSPAREFVTRQRQKPLWCWLLPKPADWRKIGPRLDREYAAQLHRELDYFEANGGLVLPDGRQFAPAQMPGLTAEIAASNQADALSEQRLSLSQRVDREYFGPDPCRMAEPTPLSRLPTTGEALGKSARIRKIRTPRRNYRRERVRVRSNMFMFLPQVPSMNMRRVRSFRTPRDGQESMTMRRRRTNYRDARWRTDGDAR